MKNRSFVIISVIFFFFGLFISTAQAGAGTSQVYRLSVTMPVTAENSMKQQKVMQPEENKMQITKNSIVRESRLVALKTMTSK